MSEHEADPLIRAEQWLAYWLDRPDYLRNPVCDDAELVVRELAQEVRDLRASEGDLLRWFSDRLTGGSAGTWDEVKHALEVVLHVADE